jgi:peptide/nickel transport system substrate-binding protein
MPPRGTAHLIALGASIALVEGCPRTPERADAETAKPPLRGLVLGTTEEPDTLDPAFTEISGAQEIVRLVFRDLTDFDPDWNIRPALAAERPSIETSTHGEMLVRWRLRPGLAWSDGAPLTAADVVFGHAIASDPKLDVTALRAPPDLLRVFATSPLELTAVWRSRTAHPDAPRTHAILPRHAYPDPARTPPPFRGLGRRPIASGPYALERWSPGQYLTLSPNPHWPGPKPKLPSITFRFFKSEDAYEAELKTGGIDALGEASGLSIERAAGMGERLAPTHRVDYTDSGLLLQMVVRLDDPTLKDPRARRAISRAIDRRSMAKLVYGEHATPAFGIFPPRHAAHARSATAAASSDDDRWSAPKNLKLKLQFASGSQASERAASYVQASLQKIGIDLALEALPFRVIMQKLKERTQAELVLFAWRTGPDFDAHAMLHSDGRQNYGGLRDPPLDRLLDEAVREPDPDRWASLLAEAEARYRSLLPTIPLLFRQAVSVHPRALEGWAPTGTTTPVTWNAELWHWN